MKKHGAIAATGDAEADDVFQFITIDGRDLRRCHRKPREGLRSKDHALDQDLIKLKGIIVFLFL